MNNSMDILDAAIAYERGVSRLADKLGVKQNVVSMWRKRQKLSTPWRLALNAQYGKHLRNAAKAALNSSVIDSSL